MMKILGLGDIFGAVLLVATAYSLDIPRGLIITVAVYLFLKALAFLFDIGSVFDIIAGILLILSLSIVLPQMVLFISAVLVGTKGIFSLFA